jgi:tetratricopeptide (TPR) repeat protein
MMQQSFLPRSVSTLVAALALACLPSSLRAESADELIKQGDVYDVKLEASKALDAYLKAEKLKPNDARICVRIARQYRHLMVDAPSKDEKLRLGGIALTYGQRAATLAPKDSDAQLSSAISYGKMLPFEGKKEQIQCSIRIRESAEKAVKLNPRNDLAWHVLGRWHRVATSVGAAKRAMASLLYQALPPSSNEDAVKCLQKAIQINPGRMMHYIELGLTFAQMGKDEDARHFLEKGLSMPDQDIDDPNLKTLGRAALAQLH